MHLRFPCLWILISSQACRYQRPIGVIRYSFELDIKQEKRYLKKFSKCQTFQHLPFISHWNSWWHPPLLTAAADSSNEHVNINQVTSRNIVRTKLHCTAPAPSAPEEIANFPDEPPRNGVCRPWRHSGGIPAQDDDCNSLGHSQRYYLCVCVFFLMPTLPTSHTLLPCCNFSCESCYSLRDHRFKRPFFFFWIYLLLLLFQLEILKAVLWRNKQSCPFFYDVKKPFFKGKKKSTKTLHVQDRERENTCAFRIEIAG